LNGLVISELGKVKVKADIQADVLMHVFPYELSSTDKLAKFHSDTAKDAWETSSTENVFDEVSKDDVP